MLRKRPSERLGYGKEGVQQLKDHPWFGGISWEAVPEKRLQSIFVPDVRCARVDLSTLTFPAVARKAQL